MTFHALLSGSTSVQWIPCPPSARLREKEPNATNAAAAKGTLTHRVSEVKLFKALESSGKLQSKALGLPTLEELRADPLYDEKVEKYSDEYVAYCLSWAANSDFVWIEHRVSYAQYAPEGSAIGDFMAYDSLSGSLHVIDLKAGENVAVYAEDNSQLKLLGLGGLLELSTDFRIESVVMHIVQPPKNYAEYSQMQTVDLLNWAKEVVEPAAKLAWLGEGEFNPGEKQCRFCRVNAKCKAYYEYVFFRDFGVDPMLLSDQEIAEIIEKSSQIDRFLKAVKKMALERYESGNPIEGTKAVAGRVTRAFANFGEVEARLKAAGITASDLYKEKSVSDIEDLLGKKQFAEHLADLVIKTEGSPVIAHESDKRKAKPTAFAVFDQVDLNLED